MCRYEEPIGVPLTREEVMDAMALSLFVTSLVDPVVDEGQFHRVPSFVGNPIVSVADVHGLGSLMAVLDCDSAREVCHWDDSVTAECVNRVGGEFVDLVDSVEDCESWSDLLGGLNVFLRELESRFHPGLLRWLPVDGLVSRYLTELDSVPFGSFYETLVLKFHSGSGCDPSVCFRSQVRCLQRELGEHEVNLRSAGEVDFPRDEAIGWSLAVSLSTCWSVVTLCSGLDSPVAGVICRVITRMKELFCENPLL